MNARKASGRYEVLAAGGGNKFTFVAAFASKRAAAAHAKGLASAYVFDRTTGDEVDA